MGNGRLKSIISGLSIAALIAGSSSVGMGMMETKDVVGEHSKKQVHEEVKHEERGKTHEQKKHEAKEQAEETKEKAGGGMSSCGGMSGCGGSGCGGMMKKGK